MRKMNFARGVRHTNLGPRRPCMDRVAEPADVISSKCTSPSTRLLKSYRKPPHLKQIFTNLAELTKPIRRTTMPPAMPDPSSRRFIVSGLLLCFFFSGAAGLIYQVAWSKALGLIFGHTAYAVATVLAVFMGGLAAGSAWLGQWSERSDRPIALYGWIELGVAASGAVSLAGLAGVRAVYVAAYPIVSGHSAMLLALRFVGAAIVLFLPTFLMGGTLPVLVRGLARDSAELGTRLARIYWVNTAGAVVGTLAAGFLFLPTLGLRQTLGVAVALNLLAGGLALRLSRQEPATRPPAMPEAASSPREKDAAPSALPSRFLCVCFGIVGATAMAYEIGWTRLLSTQLGSSTYAFTLMLGHVPHRDRSGQRHLRALDPPP